MWCASRSIATCPALGRMRAYAAEPWVRITAGVASQRLCFSNRNRSNGLSLQPLRNPIPFPAGVRGFCSSGHSSPLLTSTQLPVHLVASPAEVDEAAKVAVAIPGTSWADTAGEYISFVHDYTGLPWWAVIVCTGLTVRTCMFPFSVWALREAHRASAVFQTLGVLMQNKLNNQGGWQAKLLNKSREFNRLKEQVGTGPFIRPFIPTLIYLPVFVTVASGIRKLTLLDPPDFAREGILWFGNLSVPDQLWLLPIFHAFFVCSIIQIGLPGTETWSKIKRVLQAVTIVGTVGLATLPASVSLFCVSSSCTALGARHMLLTAKASLVRGTRPIMVRALTASQPHQKPKREPVSTLITPTTTTEKTDADDDDEWLDNEEDTVEVDNTALDRKLVKDIHFALKYVAEHTTPPLNPEETPDIEAQVQSVQEMVDKMYEEDMIQHPLTAELKIDKETGENLIAVGLDMDRPNTKVTSDDGDTSGGN